MSIFINLLNRLRKMGIIFIRIVYSTCPFQGVSQPIFIIGCGRSGTTIFGQILARHRQITYLNEPRHLWSSAYPETNIWRSELSRSPDGKLFFTEFDTKCKKSQKLSRLFQFESILTGRPIVIEKLPVNSFRLRFIRKIFPDARFIHIYRNGLEVARSIEKLSEQGGWFVRNQYKWNKLVEYATDRDKVSHLPAFCTSYFDKGLLEWRLSTEAILEFLHTLDKDTYFELSYDELLENSSETVSRVLDFIGVDDDPVLRVFMARTLSRKSEKLSRDNISGKAHMIGGSLLTRSMEGKTSLASHCI